jgi:hypothetical protein
MQQDATLYPLLQKFADPSQDFLPIYSVLKKQVGGRRAPEVMQKMLDTCLQQKHRLTSDELSITCTVLKTIAGNVKQIRKYERGLGGRIFHALTFNIFDQMAVKSEARYIDCMEKRFLDAMQKLDPLLELFPDSLQPDIKLAISPKKPEEALEKIMSHLQAKFCERARIYKEATLAREDDDTNKYLTRPGCKEAGEKLVSAFISIDNSVDKMDMFVKLIDEGAKLFQAKGQDEILPLLLAMILSQDDQELQSFLLALASINVGQISQPVENERAKEFEEFLYQRYQRENPQRPQEQVRGEAHEDALDSLAIMRTRWHDTLVLLVQLINKEPVASS